MKLRELINVIDRDTLICVCDDMGPHTDPAVKLGEVPLVQLMWELDRTVERIYHDDSDNSLVIELAEWDPKDYPEED